MLISTPFHRYRCGFTLIELLVVISIISLLVAMLLPALQSARGAAQVAQTLSNLRQIQIAVHAYASDNEDFLPYIQGTKESNSYWPVWPGTLMKADYISDPAFFWGPMRHTQWWGQGSMAPLDDMKTNKSANSYQYPGFGANPRLMVDARSTTYPVSYRLGTPFATHADAAVKAPGPSVILTMTEMFSSGAFTAPLFVDGWFQASHGFKNDFPFTYRGASATAFLDGHVAAVPSLYLGWLSGDERTGSWYPSDHGHWVRQEPWFVLN